MDDVDCVVLLSGGLDSAVAAMLEQRKGHLPVLERGRGQGHLKW